MTEVPDSIALGAVCAPDTCTSAEDVTDTGEAKVFDAPSWIRRSDVMVIEDEPALRSA